MQGSIADSSAQVALQKTDEATAALAKADESFRKAQVEEAKAKAALEQVKKEKAATEQQRKIAEENFRIAVERTAEAVQLHDQAEQALNRATQEKNRADAERDKAKAALDELEKSNAGVVRLILRNARTDVYKLEYDSALVKLEGAANLGALPEQVAKAMLEVGFWKSETGDFQVAKEIIRSAATLVENIDVIRFLR
ncbi:MAG: hypothetical protein AAB316_17065, partial [Bacteroidota bacterium]